MTTPRPARDTSQVVLPFSALAGLLTGELEVYSVVPPPAEVHSITADHIRREVRIVFSAPALAGVFRQDPDSPGGGVRLWGLQDSLLHHPDNPPAG
jgi:hypothetical protein